jgi:microcystin-dependent protein
VQALQRKITQLEGIVTPIGAPIDWLQPVGQIPASFLLADGRDLSRAAYPELFAAYGVQFGVGDGVTTFKIPDLRNLFVVGAGDDYALGQTGGADAVVLSTAQLPNHTHPNAPASIAGWADPSGIEMARNGYTGASNATFWVTQGNGDGGDAPTNPIRNLGVSASGGAIGGGQAHENRPPFFALYKIIRAR